MKRIIFALFAILALASSASAQTDTLIVSHPEEVKVITREDTLSISVRGREDEPGFSYNKTVVVDSRKEDVTTTSRSTGSGLGWDFSLIEDRNSTSQLEVSIGAQVYAGWNIMLGKPSGMNTKAFQTSEAGLDIFRFTFCPRRDKWWLSLDYGVLFSRYRFRNCMMTTAPDGSIRMEKFPDGSCSGSSFFQTLSGGLTLMGHYRVGRSHSLGLGAVWNARVIDNCSYKTKYTLSDGTVVTDMNELPIRNHLFGIKAEYMYADRIGLYLRYTPMSIFHKGKAPSFQQLNVGMQIRL